MEMESLPKKNENENNSELKMSMSVKNKSNLDVNPSELLENDLPLLSNIDEVTVLHYLIKLKFQMQFKTVLGTLIIFVKPTMPVNKHDELLNNSSISMLSDTKYPHEIILDCCSLEMSEISSLEEGPIHLDFKHQFPNYTGSDSTDWFKMKPLKLLKYELNNWSLRIYGWSSLENFPTIIRIDYKTLPKTPSLYWRPSQGGYNYTSEDLCKQCVYTAASPVNNRGIFPCQEPPKAMATWECFVTVPKPLIPLLTSDEIGSIVKEDEIYSKFYYYTSHKLPMSTFAIIVGNFPIKILKFIEPSSQEVIPVRLFSLSSNITIPKLIDLPIFVQNVLISSNEILGPHPFSRLDIIIMPPCFHTLGFANPHMIFLSPCLLNGNENNGLLIYSRIAHEIAHSWFGLCIGALDWEEEWLSEGFATYLEDIFYREAMIKCGINNQILDDDIELKIGLRLYTLQQELQNNSETNELKILIPKKLGVLTVPPVVVSSCKNGLVPLKQFIHVHYVKGYFFLKHLCSLVGTKKFLNFLKYYVMKFFGKLVTSYDFINLYYITFETKFSDSIFSKVVEPLDELQRNWFYNIKLPEPLNSIDVLNPSSSSTQNFFKNLNGFQNVYKTYEELCDKNMTVVASRKLTSNELILFFEKLLSLEHFPSSSSLLTFKRLKIFINFQPNEYNPEVIHRWCELILKFYIKNNIYEKNIKEEINMISNFLLGNPAMGVYLYGELMISENKVCQRMANNLFTLQEETLDFESKQILKEMIF